VANASPEVLRTSGDGNGQARFARVPIYCDWKARSPDEVGVHRGQAAVPTNPEEAGG